MSMSTSSNTWRCQTCSVTNHNNKERCQACLTQKHVIDLRKEELQKQTEKSSNKKFKMSAEEMHKVYKHKQRAETKRKRLLEMEKASPNNLRLLGKIVNVNKILNNSAMGMIYCEKILKISPSNDLAYNNLFWFAVSNYRKKIKQQNNISSQYEIPSCFDLIVRRSFYISINEHCESFSLINVIKYKVNHLLCGYMHRSDLPSGIKQLCLSYYVSDIINSEMYDDKLLGFTQKHKAEIIEFMLNILSPNDSTSLMLSLTNLINVIYFNKYYNYYHCDYYCGVYITLLSFASQQLNMYSLLENARYVADTNFFRKNDYNIAILKLCQLYNFEGIIHKFILKLLHGLLTANNDQYFKYYNLSTQFCNYNKITYSAVAAFLNENNIKYVRTLCGFITKYGSNIYSSDDILIFLGKQLKMNDSVRINISWLWLFNELQYITQSNDNISVNNALMKDISGTVATMLKAASSRMNIAEYSVKDTTMNTIKSLCLIFFGIGLNCQHIIKFCSWNVSFETYSSFIILTLRLSKYNVFAWKLLNAHVEQLQSEPEQYFYLQDLMRLVDSKTGLLQKSIISYIKIVNKKCEGNSKESETNLQIATKVCWKINSFIRTGILNRNKMTNFARLYNKMKKTKMVKTILTQ